MTLYDLGYREALAAARSDLGLESFEVGRVISEHRERYVVKTADKIFTAEIIGNLRYAASSRLDLPAVGDWVAFSAYEESKALIHAIYPRHSILERKAVGKLGQVQIIATNIDYGLIVQAVGRDFNLNRLERYLTICHAAKVSPLIVLTKIDLIDMAALVTLEAQIKARVADVPVISVSYKSDGYKDLISSIEKGKTYCLLGSSGVGKSTLINNLSGRNLMKTGEINQQFEKGRHVTSHRALHILPSGGIFIDNPGMREIGISDSDNGLEITFDVILKLAESCRFKDCSHNHEIGCAVLEAINLGNLEREIYDNFQKMQKEKSHFEANKLEKRRKEKEMGKMIRNILKDKRKTKF